MSTDLSHELRHFAVALFEQAGGAAEWSDRDGCGSAVVPADLAAAVQLPAEELALDADGGKQGALHVALGGEFLDAAARILDVAVPCEGTFRIGDRYLTSRDLGDKIAQSFTWQNARARCHSADPAVVEYHLWTLLATLRSEDAWEAVIRFAVNAESGAVVPLPDVFDEPDLAGDVAPETGKPPGTYETALKEGKRRLIAASADFVRRIEQRLERDRKRLQDYYRALAREAGGSRRRAVAPPSPEEIDARKRAVDLELRRKLAELNENYALRAALRPIVLARVRLPVLAVPIVIQRKQAIREYRLFWNSLLKKLEPLSCSVCRGSTYSATFTNDTVDLLCTACAESQRTREGSAPTGRGNRPAPPTGHGESPWG